MDISKPGWHGPDSTSDGQDNSGLVCYSLTSPDFVWITMMGVWEFGAEEGNVSPTAVFVHPDKVEVAVWWYGLEYQSKEKIWYLLHWPSTATSHPAIYAHNHGQNFIMMDDNARPHRARIVDNFLQGQHITRMHPWPVCSPDMNPIEHCWDQLGRAIALHRVPGDTLNDLRRYIREEWQNIPLVCVRGLVGSMRRRCQECIGRRGSNTRY